MLYKKIIKYNLIIITLTFLQLTTCDAIIENQQDLAITKNNIQISSNEYAATEYSPLLSNYNRITNYNAITDGRHKNINSSVYLNTYLDKKEICHIVIVFSTILMFFVGIPLLAFKHIEGFFVLIAALFNVFIIRKYVICSPT